MINTQLPSDIAQDPWLNCFSFTAMTTHCELRLYTADKTVAQQLASNIQANTRYLETYYNFHNLGSWLNQQINQRQGSTVILDARSLEVLKQVKHLSELTQNSFDITVGSYGDWRLQHPDAEHSDMVAELAPAMGNDSWHIEGNRLQFCDPRTRFDLGGVIKEFAVDQAAALAAQVCDASLISFGGDMRVQGKKPDGEPFKVGVKNPDQPDQVLLSLAVENMAVATSGLYERGSRDAPHIIYSNATHTKSATQKNTPSGALSVTILAADTLTAGVFSTALMLNTELPLPTDTQCVLVGQDRQIYTSLGTG